MLRYRVLPAHDCVFVHVRHILTTQDILDYNVALEQEPLWQQGMSEFIYLAQDVDYQVDPEGIRAVIRDEENRQETLAQSRIALVSERDRTFGLLRMFQLLGDDLHAEIGVFRTLGEAQAWLGLAAETLTLIAALGADEAEA